MNSSHADKLIDQYLATLDIDLNGAKANLAGWDVSIAQRNGKDVAIVIVKNCEIHFVSLDERKAMSRKNTLEFITPIFEKYGYVTTRVPSHTTDHRLREHLGFTETWRDDNYIYFVLTELPFTKRCNLEPIPA